MDHSGKKFPGHKIKTTLMQLSSSSSDLASGRSIGTFFWSVLSPDEKVRQNEKRVDHHSRQILF